MITHLEPDILGCEVKWTLGNIITNMTNRDYGISAELFQILKDDAVKVLLFNMPANLENSGHRTGKDQFSFQSQIRAVPKIVQTAGQLCSSHMLVRLCSKSFKLGFSST